MRGKLLLVAFLVLILTGTIGWKVYNKLVYTGELIGIKSSSIYHKANCVFVKKSSTEDFIFFKDLSASAKAKYRPCKTCNPPSNEAELKTVLSREEKLRKKSEQEEAEINANAKKKQAAFQKRAKQFENDYNEGKIIKTTSTANGIVTDGYYSIRRDLIRIRDGSAPKGIYKNSEDAPSWYKDNVWNPNWENDDK